MPSKKQLSEICPKHSSTFSTIFYKEDNFWYFLFAVWMFNPFRKGVYSKRKEFAPTGSKFFPFRVDTVFQMGGKNSLTELPPLKVYSLPLNFMSTEVSKAAVVYHYTPTLENGEHIALGLSVHPSVCHTFETSYLWNHVC